MPAVIRNYDPARDVDGLRACFIDLQDHEHAFAPETPTGAELVDDYVTYMLDRCDVPGGTVLVADVDGDVAGFATLIVRDRDAPDDIDLVHAEVCELSVLAAHRGKGIGTALLEAAQQLAVAAGASSFRIGADARNLAAIRLYERFGFRPAGIELHKPLATAE
jgi:ribosomal protein S18 acetylase RimI-like enzyme